MFKFLRRYNKWILAVGGVLLMITFLIPEAITRFSQVAAERQKTLASVGDGQAVSVAEWDQAQREVVMLERMERTGVPLGWLGSIQTPAHWYLLVREANQAGLIGKISLTEDQLTSYARASGENNPEYIQEALARIFGVSMMLDTYMNSAAFSDRRTKAFAERLMHTCGAELVVIQADKDKVDVEPTAEEIQAQMDAYADKLPGEGEMGFGYKLPNQMKLEWIAVSADSVRNLARNSPEYNGVAQRRHWRKHALQPGVVPDPNNPNAKNFPPVTEGADVPDAVKQDLLDELTTAKLEDIAQFAASQIQLNRRGLVEKEGFIDLPADWDTRKIDFQKLAGDIQAQFPGLELPAYQAEGDKWLSVEEAAKIKGLGTSTTDKFGRSTGVSELLNALKEFGGKGDIPFQKSLASPPMRGMDESLFVFRVIDADASRKPASVDEVRELVVGDLKRLAHYRQLEAAASDIEKRAQTDGLLAVALEHDTIVQRKTNVSLCNPRFALSQANNRQPIMPFLMPMPELGSDRRTAEAIIDRALSLPMDKPLTEVTETQRTFVVPAQDKLSLAVVRIAEQTPLTNELYMQLVQAGAIRSLMTREEDLAGMDLLATPAAAAKDDPLAKAFSFDALSKRHNYVVRGGEDEDNVDAKGM